MPVTDKNSLDEAVDGQTVVSGLLRTAGRHPDQVALKWKRHDKSWAQMTYREYADQAARVAGGLKGLGVEHGDRVALMMANRPEFHVADMAVMLCGATPVSIYHSSSADQVRYAASHAEAKVAIVDSSEYLERCTSVREQLPSLRELMIIDDVGEVDAADSTNNAKKTDALKYSDLLLSEPVDLDEAAKRVQPSDIATIIYTSGTTGAPKGVVLSHYNICWTVESNARLIGGDLKTLRSTLPVSGSRSTTRLSVIAKISGDNPGPKRAFLPPPSTTTTNANTINAKAIPPTKIRRRVLRLRRGGCPAASPFMPAKRLDMRLGLYLRLTF